MNRLVSALTALIEAASRTVDPTGTSTLRRKEKSHYRAAWARVKRRMRKAVADAPQGLSDAGKIQYFEIEFRRITREVMDVARGHHEKGLLAFLTLAMRRGATVADGDLRKGKIAPENSVDEAMLLDEYAEQVAALQVAANNDLNGIIAAVVAQAARAYAENVDMGDAAIIAAVSERIDAVGVTRTETWVEWFVVRAVNGAIILRGLQHGINRAGVREELAIWQTAGDSRVCQQCRGFATRDNGFGPGIYDISAPSILSLIPVHGRCRCRWLLLVGG